MHPRPPGTVYRPNHQSPHNKNPRSVTADRIAPEAADGRSDRRRCRISGWRKAMFHLAQVNIGRMRGELESAVMAGFVARLDEINALADCSPGFVWRLQTEAGNATYLRPYDDARILFNLSVWQDLPSLKDYAHRTAHAELLRDRRNWFEHFAGAYAALWWVPAGHIPSVDEA